MNATNTTVKNELHDLIQTCKDGQAGFLDAAEHLQNTELKTLLSSYSLQRSEFAGALQTEAHALGEHDPKNTGSLSATLHRGWIDLKSAIAGNDPHAILAECERGEDSAVAEYKKTLAADNLPADIRRVVEQQYIKIIATHDRVKELRDALKK